MIIILAHEMGLAMKKMKKSSKRDMYDSTRLSFNVLQDEEGGQMILEHVSDEFCKFVFIGASQVQPTLDILQAERISGDGMTKK